MLNSLKEALKKMLIERQHKLYNEELAARKLTYGKWIRQQEVGLEIADIICCAEEKCLKSEFGNDENDACEKKNEGKLAENVVESCFLKNTASGSLRSDEEKILWLRGDFSLPVIEGILEKIDTRDGEAFVFVSFYEGEISRVALPLITRTFNENKNLILIYGDEDRLQAEERINPWFKPDWSPDTFLSYFYFGGLVAVRQKNLKEAYDNLDLQERMRLKDGKELLYRLFCEMLKAGGGFKIGHDSEHGPAVHLPYVLFHSREDGFEQIKNLQLPVGDLAAAPGEPGDVGKVTDYNEVQLSVIIPSKDNPKVLFQCIDSLITRTGTNCTYEILVIDNGSNEENKGIIEKKIQALQESAQKPAACGDGFAKIKYLYHPMTFNFSVMCNMGAEAAEGSLLLFLNDDMEIIQPDWLELMLQKVRLPYVGAVGAKLVYPGTDIIQHAGITNLRVGPAHKLQYLSDEKIYYFGKNRGVHNMLAVTGACLMVRKDVFRQAGGFAPELAVAFNDVDLCYTIHELGYYNVVRNDVVLYHHESLSRGKDGESTEKQLRLQREKDILYERHQDIYGKDPFYHQNLTMDMLEAEYSPAFHYQVKLDMPWSEAQSCAQLIAKAREDKCLVVGMECAMDLYKWQYGISPEKGKVKPKAEDMGYYFQGYSFVIGADNACYKKKLLLKNGDSGEVFAIPMESRYRQDIKKNLKDQINVDLTGYAAKLQKDKLPEG
ncbi:MAG: glycosyltransferase, partial [Lachnospiraceae bacterium]|nr:glycosyltransferase [Lachnospiraceae bacterium]